MSQYKDGPGYAIPVCPSPVVPHAYIYVLCAVFYVVRFRGGKRGIKRDDFVFYFLSLPCPVAHPIRGASDRTGLVRLSEQEGTRTTRTGVNKGGKWGLVF